MAIQIKEIEKKKEDLMEQGSEAQNNVKTCKARVSQAQSNLASAMQELDRASQTDEEGNPVGDVHAAQARVNMAQNQLAASERAFNEAQKQLESVNERKKGLVTEIDAHNDIEKNNLEKLKALKKMAFADSSDALSAGIAERLNEAEAARAELLASLGINEGAQRFSGGGAGSGAQTWGSVSGLESLAIDYEETSIARKALKAIPNAIGFTLAAMVNPFQNDVNQWDQKRDEISDKVRNYCSKKYGKYIKPDKLKRPLSDTVRYENSEMFKFRGMNPNVLGYNDGKLSHVRVGSGHELQTTIHENFHQLSANGSKRGIIKRIPSTDKRTYIRKNVQINEAITELFTQRALGSEYGPDYSGYSENRDAIRLIEDVMGEEIFARAYFQNRPELIADRIDAVLGKGSWEELSLAFDDSMSKIRHTRESGRVRRDNIINRYRMAVFSSNQGDNSWINSFF